MKEVTKERIRATFGIAVVIGILLFVMGAVRS